MDKKITDTVNNICTILGGALLLYPLIDEAAKTVIPEMQKLSSGEATEGLKMLPEAEKKKEPDDSKDNEIAELKRKLQEYEEKQKAQDQQ